MFRCVRRDRSWVRAGLAALLIAASGCNKAWNSFESVELGRPLPSGPDAPETRRGRYGTALGEMVAWCIPPIADIRTARTLTDADGIVDARSYLRATTVHWGLLVSIDTHHVVEVDVPEKAFREPPAGWCPDEKERFGTALAGFLGMLLRPKAGEPQCPEAIDDGCSAASTRSTCAESQPVDRLAFFQATILGLARDDALPPGICTSTQPRATATAPNPRPPVHVAQYVQGAKFVMELNPVSADASDDAMAIGIMDSLVASLAFGELLGVRGAFSGVTQPGYVWRHTSDKGMRYVVRNLGGRRVRVEIDGITVRSVFATRKPAATATQPAPASGGVAEFASTQPTSR